MENTIAFHRFLAMVRRKKGITLSTLGKGLYSESMMCRIEEGKRTQDRLVRNRLLSRLGISSEGFEDYVQPDEYGRYVLQKQIIEALESGDMSLAKTLTDELEDRLTESNKVYIQFVYDVRSRIAKEENDLESWSDFSKKALLATVESASTKDMDNMLLAPEEYYYFLRYLESMAITEDTCIKTMDDYENVINHIKNADMDNLGKAKVFPMAVYGLYMCVKNLRMTANLKKRIWKYSEEAIDILRESCRQYYLLQILKLRKELSFGKVTECEEQWIWAIEYANMHYGTNMDMNLNCFIYSGTSVFCIGDVIRRRREMFGLSRDKLAEDVCDVKTLLRLENQRSNVRQESINPILDRLKLPKDFIRLPIVTDNEKAVSLYNELRYALNQLSVEQQEKILAELMSILDMKNSYNRQALEVVRAISEKNNGRISSDEYENRLMRTLEDTVNVSEISFSAGIFFTSTEIICIYNIAKEKRKCGEKDELLEKIIGILFDGEEGCRTDNSMDFLLRIWLADIKGTPSEYKESDLIADNAARWILRNGRISGLHMCLYNNLWNDSKYSKVPNDVAGNTIKACIYLSDFSKDHKNFEHYKKKYNYMVAGDENWVVR